MEADFGFPPVSLWVRAQGFTTHVGDQTMTNLTCAQAAQSYLDATTAPAKAKLAKYIADKAASSKRVRWERLLAAVQAGDVARIQYRAAPDAAGRKAALANFSAIAPAKAKQPKAAKAKAVAKPKADTPADPMAALVSGLDAMNPDQLAAFLTAYVTKRK